ncbi:MAG: PAS domain S-box protein [Desertifilum sp. SIO1I2]|nr:PAS domain S-box protein [Desertifilum sp. SIO1I2]
MNQPFTPLSHSDDAVLESSDLTSLSLRDRQLRSLFETALDAMAIADDRGLYIEVNWAACELFGLPREELIGRCIAEFTEPGVDFTPTWQQFQQQGQMRGEFRLVRADGAIREVEYAATAHFIPHRHLSIIRDITERKQAEAKIQQLTQQLEQRVLERTRQLEETQAKLQLTHNCYQMVLEHQMSDRQHAEKEWQQSEDKFRAIFQQAGVGINQADLSGRFIQVNPGFCQLLGYTEAELLQLTFQQVTHSDDLAGKSELIRQLYNGDIDSCMLEQRYIHKNGSVVWTNSVLSILRDPDGNPISDLAIVQDISDRKQTELALQHSEAMKRAMWEAIPDLMFYVNRNGVYLNYLHAPQFANLVDAGVNPINRCLTDVLPLEVAQRHLYYIQIALDTGEVQTYEQQVRIDGKLYYEEVRVIPVETDKVLFMIRDISDRKQMELALQQSEAENRAILRSIPDLLFYVNAEGVYLNYLHNPGFPDLIENSVNPIGQRLEDTLPPEVARRQRYHLEQVVRTGEIQAYEQETWVDNKLYYEEVRVIPVEGDKVLFAIRDISALKQAEIALREERSLFIGGPTVVFKWQNAEGWPVEYVSPNVRSQLGYDPEFFLRTRSHYIDLIHPDDRMRVAQDIQNRIRAGERYYEQEYRLRRADGEYCWLYDFTKVAYTPQGQIAHFLGYVQDISDRKAIETQRQQAEAQLQGLLVRTQLVNSISTQIRSSLDLETILQNAVNAIYTAIQVDICTFGWYRSQTHSPSWEIVIERKVPELPSWLGQYAPDRFLMKFEKIFQGQIYCVDRSSQLPDEQLKSFRQTYGISAYVCIPIHTAGQQIGGFELGRIAGDRPWSSEEIELLQEVTNQVAIAIEQAELYRASEEKSRELAQAYTELQQAQTRLIQVEKMSSLGQLVAGIAHEINNPVSFIYGNLQPASEYVRQLISLVRLYQQSCPQPPSAIAAELEEIDFDYLASDFPELLNSMKTGASRIRDIVKSLRTFSRLDEADFKRVNLHESLDSTLVILQNRLNGKAGEPKINVIKNYGNVPRIECYSGLLNQVFLNLLSNAVDAIEQQRSYLELEEDADYRGEIAITTTLSQANWLCISIEDNGCGMSIEVQKKIFNPFFTTKPVGKGTGMGLATSYQIIVEDHGGNLQCISTLGQGTNLMIELPICAQRNLSCQL